MTVTTRQNEYRKHTSVEVSIIYVSVTYKTFKDKGRGSSVRWKRSPDTRNPPTGEIEVVSVRE